MPAGLAAKPFIEALKISSCKQRLATSSTTLKAGPNGLEPPDMRKLAQLAQIQVTDEEVS